VGKLIVVVDDDPTILTLVELVLRRFQFNVMTFDDPLRALDVLESLSPDLFILDLMMPRISGTELCKRIRSHPHTRHVPIIILSALSAADGFVKGLEAGADVFVPKTALNRDLVTSVHRLLNTTADVG
jgi:two-component system cell cycle response regulator